MVCVSKRHRLKMG